jgi:4,5-DOPA dioxygenase extradiol
VLIVGSGFTTHGLPFLRDFRTDAPAPGWSREFDAWTAETLARGAVDELADFRSRAPGMPWAHPTIEHFAPMFLTLGAADDPERAPEQPIEGFWMGLSKRSFQVA